jgi:hypothetical protein
MSETEKSFTVSDRRHFTPEGRPREREAGATEQPAGEAQANGERTASGAPRRAEPARLTDLLLSLAAQASLLLSRENPPDGPSPVEALEAAGSVISVLEMLKDKTEGRRTADEDALLDDLLFQLRMAWVEKSRAVPR